MGQLHNIWSAPYARHSQSMNTCWYYAACTRWLKYWPSLHICTDYWKFSCQLFLFWVLKCHSKFYSTWCGLGLVVLITLKILIQIYFKMAPLTSFCAIYRSWSIQLCWPTISSSWNLLDSSILTFTNTRVSSTLLPTRWRWQVLASALLLPCSGYD